MPVMTISAEFPLGTYLGHADVGNRSPFPDPARLFSTLVHAASKGSTAVIKGDDLRMNETSAASLLWLEQHPPEALQQAEVVPVAQRPASAWRSDGVFEKRGSAVQARRVLKHQSAAYAVRGRFSWTWPDVPESVVRCCSELAADVSCLGEADSPVRLRVTTDAPKPTHVLDATQTGFPEPGGLPVRTPLAGRLAELETDYERTRGAKRPSLAADRYAITQLPSAGPVSSQAVERRIYRSLAPHVAAPWTHAIVLPISGGAAAEESFGQPRNCVRWAVALHRAVAAGLGDDAPPSITGARAPDGSQMPNRCAIHCLPAQSPVSFGQPGGAFIVLVPENLPPSDLQALGRALQSVRRVWLKATPGRKRTKGDRSEAGSRLEVGAPEFVQADHFWRPKPAGTRRLWAPRVPLIPEIRGHRRHGWDLDRVAKLSVGHVWRARLGAVGGREDLIRAVTEHGVRVYAPQFVLDSHVSNFVHKAPRDVVVQPYTCVLDLGDLAQDQTVMALGQTRHLGGGLLMPVDVADVTKKDGAR